MLAFDFFTEVFLRKWIGGVMLEFAFDFFSYRILV